ncbi:hypothetical protein JNB_19193 [Janibacter sp. HTCC2649]|nr:hypothetical protein JNB_19193 [Janibacter sp. HTCC2649]
MATDEVSVEELTLLLWGIRAFLLLVSLLLAAILVACWWVVAGRAFAELGRGWRAHDLWLPFLRDERGEWGPLTSNPRWALARAEERGSTRALAWRWGFWIAAALGLTVGVLRGLWGVGQLLVLGWP